MRTVPAILAEAEAIDWALWDVQPQDRLWDYRASSVPAAFACIAGVRSKSDADDAYNRIMDALGHNHSGTPYPAMVAGARLLAELVPLLRGWQSATVVNVLTDCYLWTRGEAEVVTKDGRTYDPGAETALRQCQGHVYERRRGFASAHRDLSESADRTGRRECARACRPRGASACCPAVRKASSPDFQPILHLETTCRLSRCTTD
ncbi:hypothetical protein [Cellulomonas xiejunii]|uniref:Uncharacterized protein n=1 Tax=Cellulomonas xiejunii TaxID=2968083 RepID=A0ABY5KMU8_9CELL|nr:hypothetical protein [Cellulomonas xiejunii]MCC2321245.1 hypothetical protein [Cellulomonas xiejunii]UUI71832.1 hypothetical protein NP048_18930 [Cellulomonas xiejunii]